MREDLASVVLLVLRNVSLVYDNCRHLLQAEHLQDEEQAVRVEQDLAHVVKLHHVCVPIRLRDRIIGRDVHARETLNHLRERSMMADTALHVISR
jgi:hypothetical protein